MKLSLFLTLVLLVATACHKAKPIPVPFSPIDYAPTVSGVTGMVMWGDPPCKGECDYSDKKTVYALATAELAELIDGKCSLCVKQGFKSTVVMNGFASCTAAGCGAGHYDEDGNYQPPKPCNSCTAFGHCSRGHSVLRTWKSN